MSATVPTTIDATTARRVEEAIAGSRERLDARQQLIEAASALASVIAAVALMLVADADRTLSIPIALTFVVAYAAIARVGFNVGAGYVVPTQLVFFPMLLLLPTPMVPLLVTLGAVLTKLVSVA